MRGGAVVVVVVVVVVVIRRRGVAPLVVTMWHRGHRGQGPGLMRRRGVC